jgi:predicted transposase YdaD
MSLNKEERGAYEDHLKWLRIQEDTLDKRYLDGKIEGKIEGIQIGEAKGLAMLKSLINNLHLAGQGVEFIAKVTKMNIAEVQKIIDDIL